MSDCYQALAQAIIMQAVKDWRDAMKKLRKRPKYEPAIQVKKECERFFLSEWFYELSGVDGSVILKKLKKEEESYDE